jgi:MerR family transcriptional regulator, redox-sensitive transcriptional activator SoxR
VTAIGSIELNVMGRCYNFKPALRQALFDDCFLAFATTIAVMANLTISEVARQVGLRPSAIRYYEQVGILPPARRISGQRRYDLTVVYRLAVVRRAQEVGFTLNDIRDLFLGFRPSTPVSARWRKIAEQKLVELQARMDRLRTMQELLKAMQACCRCETVDECGAGIFRKAFQNPEVRPPVPKTRPGFQ